MAVSITRLLSSHTLAQLPLRSRYLAAHVPRRYVQEFPETRFDNSTPRDYLLVLPEKLNETNNELLRVPQFGQPEIDFSKLNVELCYKGLSQAVCTFENFVTDVNNQISSPYNTPGELFKDIEKHLIPMDFAYNLIVVLSIVKGQEYAYKEIHDLMKRYYDARAKRYLSAFKDSLEINLSADSKNLSQSDKKMMRLYQVNPRMKSGVRPLDDSSLFLFQKNLKDDLRVYARNLHEANRLFVHTIDDPDILASVSSDLEECKYLHHSDRTPLQITAGTYYKFMRVCPDRFVRHIMWQTYNRRCSPKGLPKQNNMAVIKSIRIWRRKIADMSGYRSHFDYRLQDTMAASRQRVLESFEAIHQDNKPKLHDRLQELYEFAADNKLEDASNKSLREYDIDYWSQRYMHDILIGLSETDLKGYFPFKAVMSGVKNYFSKFFSIDFNFKTNTSDKFWSRHVQLIELTKKGQPLGNVIYDPFYRSSQNPYEVIQARLRSRVQGAQCAPARFLSTPYKIDPTTGQAHLTVYDVMNLFYCFTETIQEFLHNYQYYELNTYGTIELDVRDLLPKLCLAHIMSDHRILQSCSDRGGSKPIDSELTNRILKANLYFRPFTLWRELYKAHLDMESHTLLTETKNIVENLYTKYSPFPRDQDNFDYCAMSDIFLGPNDGIKFADLWSRQLATFCLSNIQDQADGKVDELKMKEFYEKLTESLFDPVNLSTDDKLTALVGKRFEPSKTTLGVL